MGSRASGSASSRLICSQYRFENAPDMSIARKVPRRARKTAVGEFVADSALEEKGFEPSVPVKKNGESGKGRSLSQNAKCQKGRTRQSRQYPLIGGRRQLRQVRYGMA